MIDINAVMNGKTFYNVEMATALQEALDFVGTEGYVATAPEIIAALSKVDRMHHMRTEFILTAHTEENTGRDSKGKFYSRDEPILVLVNGGGLITYERIKKIREETYPLKDAIYTDTEFDELLEGKLADGTTIEMYSFEQVKEGISNIGHRFGIVMPYSLAQNSKKGSMTKKEFLEDPLVIARNAGTQNLEEYFENDKYQDTVVCQHSFNDKRGFLKSYGRLLFFTYGGLGNIGYNWLGINSRFLAYKTAKRSE